MNPKFLLFVLVLSLLIAGSSAQASDGPQPMPIVGTVNDLQVGVIPPSTLSATWSMPAGWTVDVYVATADGKVVAETRSYPDSVYLLSVDPGFYSVETVLVSAEGQRSSDATSNPFAVGSFRATVKGEVSEDGEIHWEWSLCRVSESPSLPVGYILWDEDGDNITPCGGNYVLEASGWTQRVDFANCPDNFCGVDGDGGNWFYKPGETHGLSVQPVAIFPSGKRVYGEISEVCYVSLPIPTMPEFSLVQNYPNPFNPTTTISYSIVGEANIDLAVYNMVGQQVADLYSGRQTAGVYTQKWDASSCPSGTYFLVLEMSPVWDGTSTLDVSDLRVRRDVKKMTLMK